MPFKSEAQRRFMHANHPEIANRWEKEYKDDPVQPGKSKKKKKTSKAVEGLKKANA